MRFADAMFAIFTRERTFEDKTVKVAVRTVNIANIGTFFRPVGKNSALASLTKLEGAIAERFRSNALSTMKGNQK